MRYAQLPTLGMRDSISLSCELSEIFDQQKIEIMKTKITSLLIVLAFGSNLSFAQDSKPSIAVSNPNVNGLSTKTESVAKMIRLELIKMDKHLVLDEFDMGDIVKGNTKFQTNCLGQQCLSELGTALKVDFMASGSFDALGNKIAVTIKVIDVKNQKIFKSLVKEFDDQEAELQRMIEITLKEMYGLPVQKEIIDRISYKNELITTNNVGKINNSGPRIGYAYLLGSMNEFARRSEDQGGLDIFPGVSMIGYQLEGQYVGTENFSALVEGIFNVSGLEQGQFIPSLTLMNGFRFGKAGWEIAFGPGFSLKKTSFGFFDTEGLFGGDKGDYFSQSDWSEYVNRELYDKPEYNTQGFFIAPEPSEFNPDYNFDKRHGDTRGTTQLNTLFVFAFGRTFRAGALNIPVNVFYSSQKGGGMAGVNVGFNVQKSKSPMNRRR